MVSSSNRYPSTRSTEIRVVLRDLKDDFAQGAKCVVKLVIVMMCVSDELYFIF